MRQEYQTSLREYHTSYDEPASRAQSQFGGRHAQTLVAENARAQEMKEQQTSELAPGAYMMGKIVEQGGNRYRSGRGEHGKYMTTDDYANLYRSRRVCHVNENGGFADMGEPVSKTQYSRAAASAYTQKDTQREVPVRSVRESGNPTRTNAPAARPRVAATGASRPQTVAGQGVRRAGKASTTAPAPATRKASTVPASRRETVAPVAAWLPSGERYIRVRNQKRFPLAMVMMIIAVSVSLMLIVCGSVMTSHMEREVCALNNELAELNDLAEELEGELALKNDPLKMEQLAAELGMVRGEYVETRLLRTTTEEHTVVYDTEEQGTLSLATLLSAFGFFKD